MRQLPRLDFGPRLTFLKKNFTEFVPSTFGARNLPRLVLKSGYGPDYLFPPWHLPTMDSLRRRRSLQNYLLIMLIMLISKKSRKNFTRILVFQNTSFSTGINDRLIALLFIFFVAKISCNLPLIHQVCATWMLRKTIHFWFIESTPYFSTLSPEGMKKKISKSVHSNFETIQQHSPLFLLEMLNLLGFALNW